jgi:hypothetical protein
MTCRSLLIAESLSALYTTMRRCLCSTCVCVCVCVLVYMHMLGTDKLCTGISEMCGA